MNIRFGRKEDIESLVRISKESFSEPFSEGDFKSTFNNSLEVALIAEESGEILGYCDFTVAGVESELLQIAVSPKKRGQKIGKTLFSTMISILKEKGVLNLFLEVRESNDAAIFLYSSFGMTRVGTRKGFYNDPKEDALIYRLDL